VKLKSAVFQNALKAAYSSLGMSATYSKAGIGFLSALQGYFLLVLDEVDNAFTLDATVVSFFKSLSDSSEAAELAVLTFYKSLADEVTRVMLKFLNLRRAFRTLRSFQSRSVKLLKKVTTTLRMSATNIFTVIRKY